MQIYNSLTRQKEEFEPLNPPQVNIYTCGVTVYDQCHIGHARSLYIFDVIRRYLERKKFKVNFVRNITDIDDKIINRANQLKIDWKELVGTYLDSYRKDLELLGIGEGILDKDGEEPRATKSIPDMIKYVEGLIHKGYAYQADGDVYFKVRKFPDYGKLSGQSIEQIRAGARIEPTELKKDPLDFALWKSSKENEPSWDSPWGKGRPGWHIECSVMSQKFLKTDTLDIHGGGRDLIFPHHENEIAQAQALTGKTFARYWLHHGLLTINGQKMAKSLGNFVTVRDALKKYSSDVLKLFFLQTHYSQPIDFSWEIMEEKRTALSGRILRFLNNVERAEEGKPFPKIPDINKISSPDILKHKIESLCTKFNTAMDNDFNTPQAVASLFKISGICEGAMRYDTYERNTHLPILREAKKIIEEFGGDILGLSFKKEPLSIPEEEIRKKVDIRTKLREKGYFKEADLIRKDLEKKGIVLEDGAEGTTWRPC